jgi:hypothetical protein
MNIRYTVVCTLKDADVVDNYLIWLKDSHIKDVIALGGALSAEVLVKGRNSMLYISMYICLYVYVHTYDQLYENIGVNMCVNVYTHEQIYIHVWKCIYANVYIHKYTKFMPNLCMIVNLLISVNLVL